MNNFTYSRAGSPGEAFAVYNNKTAYIGGGTNIIDLMKNNVMRPSMLIDINHIQGTQQDITETTDGGLRLGASVTNAVTAWHPLVEKRFPLISKAILAGASPQIRNMATNGGNLLQRTRCYYFYDTATPCNKRDPGSGCSAIHGYSRIHAILGASEQCIATHPSDFCVGLTALDAVIEVNGPEGTREIAFEDFHRLPGDTPEIDNNLGQGEIITAIRLPANRFANHHSYIKVRDRSSFAFALVSVATAFEMKGDTIVKARIALGGVAHKPWRNKNAEEYLAGQKASDEVFEKAASIILDGAQGLKFNMFKIRLAARAIVRSGLEATKSIME